MSILPYFIKEILLQLVNIYVIIIVVWALFSWFDHSKGFLRDIYNVLDKLVRPYINVFKRFIPPMGGIDITPIIAIIALQLVIRLIVYVL
jgi:YggT family protein